MMDSFVSLPMEEKYAREMRKESSRDMFGMWRSCKKGEGEDSFNLSCRAVNELAHSSAKARPHFYMYLSSHKAVLVA